MIRYVLILVCLCIAFAIAPDASGGVLNPQQQKLDRLVQTSTPSDEVTRTFREGRDLIADEKWAQAAQKFDQVIKQYADSEYVDAAYYWLAFTLKKQEKFVETDRMLNTLINQYPRSNWLQDAKAMQVEIAPRLGRGEEVANEAQNAENDEIKIVALQSLYQANPERAMSFIMNILSPGSTESTRVKEATITLLGKYNDDVGGEQATKTLLNMVQTEQDVNLRKKAIYQLGRGEWSEAKFSFSEEQAALTVLKDLAMASEDREIADSAVSALAHIANHHPELDLQTILVDLANNARWRQVRQKSISRLVEMINNEGRVLTPDLIAIYDANDDVETKRSLISALSRIDDPQARNKVVEIARTADHQDLRRRAIYVIGERGDLESVNALSSLFQMETDMQVKEQIMGAFSQSKHIEALRQLMVIAKTDPSVKIRTKAISYLGRSKNPEAVKFIEEILQ